MSRVSAAMWIAADSFMATARSAEDETQNGHRNEKRNPNRDHEPIVLGLFSHENLKRAIKR